MSKFELIIAKDKEEAAILAADRFEACIHAKPDCVLGLATGSTPILLYQELVKREKNGKLSFSAVRSANLDEYKGLASDHPQSYRRFMQEQLFDHISIKPENTIIPDGLAEDGEAMCMDYENKIKALGSIDLQLLGIGHDGHIGFNEPCDHFPEYTHEVELTEITLEANKRFFASIDEVPRAAFTMGVGTIMAAKQLLLLVTGADKAEILAKTLHGPITPQVPASVLRLHQNLIVICDQAAASML